MKENGRNAVWSSSRVGFELLENRFYSFWRNYDVSDAMVGIWKTRRKWWESAVICGKNGFKITIE